MSSADSALDLVALSRVRALVRQPEPARRLWPALAAAMFAALSALAFATAMIMAPATISHHLVVIEKR
jgi:hypothetical protein